MIYDNVKNYEKYKDNKDLFPVLEYLYNLNGKNIKETFEFNSNVTLHKISTNTKPFEECLFESHKKNIDIHFIIEGEERIDISEVNTLTISKEYDNSNDIQFLEGNLQNTFTLKKGNFLVCYPNDAHKVCIMVNAPSKLEKIVAKLKV